MLIVLYFLGLEKKSSDYFFKNVNLAKFNIIILIVVSLFVIKRMDVKSVVYYDMYHWYYFSITIEGHIKLLHGLKSL